MGLIGAGLLSGLGAGLGGAAQEISRRDREEELLRERLLDRERERQSREAIARDNNDLKALIAGARGSSGGGSAAGGMQDFSEGSPGEALRAKSLGMSVPEYRQFEEANRTGNVDAFKRDVTRTEPPTVTEGQADPNDSGMDRRLKSTFKEGSSTTTKELPKGFDEWIREKRKEAAQAEIILRSSGDADNKIKAIGNASKNRLIADVVDAPTQEEARRKGERIGLADGKGQFDNDGYRMINKATGENTETPEGKARAEKDQALAGKAGREPVARGGGGGGGGAGPVSKEEADAYKRVESARKVSDSAARRLDRLMAQGGYVAEKGETREDTKSRYDDDVRSARARVKAAESDFDKANSKYLAISDRRSPPAANPAAPAAPSAAPAVKASTAAGRPPINSFLK